MRSEAHRLGTKAARGDAAASLGRQRRSDAGAEETADRTVVVLLGGPSAEHDVSVVSGWAIADALEGAGLPVERLYIDLAGGWWHIPATASRGRPRPGSFDAPASVGARGPKDPAQVLRELSARPAPPLVFPALHGPFGEDGTIQAMLEAYDLAYAGAGVAASAIGMDKAIFKRLVAGLGVKVVEWDEVTVARWARDRRGVLDDLEAFAERVGTPELMVKPARMGSSVGLTLAHAASERAPALDLAFEFDTLAIVERYLDHPRELEVAVIGNDPAALEAYGPGEVLPGREFYDYVAKYTDGVSDTRTSPDLDPALARSVRAAALDAYRAAGCEGFARVDFLLDGEVIYLSEINTIPGFTPISLFPQLASAALGDFTAVCLRIVELARERHAGRVRQRLTAADLPR
jgi:D-alanine-D-alanine ligase